MSRLLALISAFVVCISFNSFAEVQQVIVDGGFEQSNTFWSAYYLPGGKPPSAGIVSLGNAFNGTWYAYVGDVDIYHSNSIGVVRQLFTMPSNAKTATLSFYLDVTSQDTTAQIHDRMGAYLRTYPGDQQVVSFGEWSNLDRDPTGNKKNYLLKTCPTTGPVDVSLYAGQSMLLQFYGITDSTSNTTFRIDDVSLSVSVSLTVGITAGPNGGVAPNGNVSVDPNGSVSISASPNSNYVVDAWYVNGLQFQVGGNTLTLQSITQDTQVEVTFKQATYPVNIQVYGSGSYSISPPGGSYAMGTPITINSNPDSGNQFSEWRGAYSSRNPTLAFEKGGADDNIELHFSPILIPTTLIVGGISVGTANSTPTTLNVDVPTHTTYLALCEESNDLNLWNIYSVLQGQSSTPISVPMVGPSGFLRTFYVPQITTRPFLDFPIHLNGANPYTAQITAVLDHHRAHPEIRYAYDKDHAIRTALGLSYPVLPENQGSLKDFAIIPAGVCSTLFTYTGVNSPPEQAGPSYLQYDGHPGYDYRFDLNTDVYAAADGEVMTDDDLAGTNLQSLGMVSFYMTNYHALVIRHPLVGYCSIYMHLSAIDSTFANTPQQGLWMPIKAKVSAGQHIGNTGQFDLTRAILPHFHFEVWRLDCGNTWNYADPYGYSFQAADGSRIQITPQLWTGN
jgi:murein DD-endopeptidase MepM/ murein hydrolase activator NlpD